MNGSAEEVRPHRKFIWLVARAGKTVKLARSLDRPLGYFLAKRQAGPVLIVAARIDTIHDWLKAEGLEAQFGPAIPEWFPPLRGCAAADRGPDPDPVYTRFFTPAQGAMTTDLDEIGTAYIGCARR